MVLCYTLNNSIGYSEFLKYLDSGGWALSMGINDRMDKEEHLSYINRMTTLEDAQIEFILNDTVPELVEKIDVYIKPTIRESEPASTTKHVQFVKKRR